MQENVTYSQENNHSIETDPKSTEMMEMADKDIRTAILKRFRMPKNIKENMNTMRRNTEVIKKK